MSYVMSAKKIMFVQGMVRVLCKLSLATEKIEIINALLIVNHKCVRANIVMQCSLNTYWMYGEDAV